ncbi:hypothetical protein [Acidovorax sp. SD340]|uniref:hypothetical protein n=1 Tax=Acidovorax sp. SD340 TaxID=1690268 RepID=UPI0012E10AAC|nr:hypothetical protein [Acidovorax sp. SD340]
MLALGHPCVHHAAAFFRQAVDAWAAQVAVAVNELDAFAWEVVITQTTAAQVGNQVRPVGASRDAIDLLARDWTAQQHGYGAKVARVVGSGKLTLASGALFCFGGTGRFHLTALPR